MFDFSSEIGQTASIFSPVPSHFPGHFLSPPLDRLETRWPHGKCARLRIEKSGFEPGCGHCFVLLGKTLYSQCLSPSRRRNRYRGIYCWVTLPWTSISSRGSTNTPCRFVLRKPGISAGLMGHLARMQTLPFLTCQTNICTQAVLLFRIWKASRYTQDRSRRRRLLYRRRLNRMVIALTLFFFVLELPCQVGNVVAMTTGYYSYTRRAAFYLEILAQCNVLYPAWVYLLLNTSYRMTLKQLLTGSPRQRTTNARELDVPRGNQRQGAAGRNRDNERARVRFNAKVSTLPQPSTPCAKTNGNIQASGTTSLSKTHQGGTGNDNEERISKDKRSEEQSTDF